MGWKYLSALWGYFHLNPLNLGVGVVEYLLRSLAVWSSFWEVRNQPDLQIFSRQCVTIDG